MNPETGSAALAAAIEAEKVSLEGYLHYAWRTRDAGGRGMFIRLAGDEFDHMRLLERQQAALVKSGDWLPVSLPPSLIESLVPRLSEAAIRVRGESGQNDVEALRTALALENAAVRVYSGLAADATGQVRLLFGRLAEMEQSHVALVQAELDSIQGEGFWFGVPEFTLESERPAH